MRLINKSSGFTLVEIIAVLVILGILAATAVPKYFDLQRDAQRKAATTAVAEAQARINLSFSQFLLIGGRCTNLDGASLENAYAKPTIDTKILDIADTDGTTIGGWKISANDSLVSRNSVETAITQITTPGGVAIDIEANSPDLNSFKLYFPQCE